LSYFRKHKTHQQLRSIP